MPKDPVCNMDVDETTAKYVSEFKGKKYFFLRSWLQSDVRQRSGEIRLSLGSRQTTELPVAHFFLFWAPS